MSLKILPEVVTAPRLLRDFPSSSHIQSRVL
jgi:hypothetical protein